MGFFYKTYAIVSQAVRQLEELLML